MTLVRSVDQRAAFIRSAAADLDVAPKRAERLLALSEAARDRSRAGPIEPARRRWLLDVLADDELCRHAWWVAAAEGESLWWELLTDAEPPRDAGPAVLLAVALAARGAGDHAFELIRRVIATHAAQPSVLELGIDLAEDAGRADLAWSWVQRLDGGISDERWSDLRRAAGFDRAALRDAGAMVHARWLRRRTDRWARRRWSPLPAPDPAEGTVAADPVAAAALDYLEGRRSLLPIEDRDVLNLWARAARGHFSVVRAGRREVVLEGPGRRHIAGWECPAVRKPEPGAVVDGWLLPTLAAGRSLFVASSRPPAEPAPV